MITQPPRSGACQAGCAFSGSATSRAPALFSFVAAGDYGFMDQSKPEKAHVRYPNHYTWLVFVASLDILMTYVILHLGGLEANPLAAKVIYRWGVPGMVIYKFCFIIIAILIAEVVGRRKEHTGRKFLEYAIVISAFPVILALVLLAVHG